jgi:arylsulfatase A-like enzyme/Flp pilus assembly protein TadD
MKRAQGGIAVLVILAAFVFSACGRTRQDGPIILISIDTLRADHLPAYGYDKVRTPNIDTLAAESVVFDRAWSHAPETLPAHTSILTGELPFEHGVRDNVGFTVKPEQWTLARALAARGWPTGGFVSAFVLRKATGIGQGFETYDSEMPPSSAEVSIGQVQRRGEDTLAAAEKWLDARDRRKRFFLFFHIYEPHKPYSPPPRFAMYAPYDGEIAYADEIVGRFFDHLRGMDLYDRATIILLADHGEGLGDHGEQEHGLFLYRETTRVPLVVKLPGRHESRRVSVPVQHIDVAPTILDLAGAARVPSLKGRSLRPLLDGSGGIADADIYAEAFYSRYHFGWSELYSLTDARYRLIRAPRDELFDEQNDPAETKSLAASRPQVTQAMRSAIGRLIANASIAAPTAVSDEDRQKLAALGYIGGGADASLALAGDSLPAPTDKVHVLEKYRRAADLAGQRKFEEATTLYREVLAEDPGMTDVWLQLAEVYVRQGMSEEAVHAYGEAIRRNPKDPGSLIGAAAQLLRLGRLDEARRHGELAVPLAPAGGHEILARIALARKDKDGAMKEAQLAQQADPTLPMPLYIEGLLLYNQGQFAAALPPLLRARDAMRGRTLQMNDLNYYIGDSLARLERYGEAEPFLLEEVRVFPQNNRARAGLAMLYRAMGRDAASERAIDDLLRISPTREGRDMAAQLYRMFGEPDKAARVQR